MLTATEYNDLTMTIFAMVGRFFITYSMNTGMQQVLNTLHLSHI